ncbi:hypothetical protein B4135_4091 [Caldibacillus debilis]|uniref:Uncharacterized protein n=1 Tax=Caldibacillus debilis TaxID=301148 RepID=A0A150L801_9BACI|nr:hypothetical protein B4135_4091 [Caldibacillus debilis]
MGHADGAFLVLPVTLFRRFFHGEPGRRNPLACRGLTKRPANGTNKKR